MPALSTPQLPAPSPEALAHSARLSTQIRDAIAAAEGWIAFPRYMALALYAPGLGYYAGGAAKFGGAGDFVTAPELTPLFGRTLARPIADSLAQTGGDLLELGAGSGRLAVEVLHELERLHALPPHYFILEISPDLRARQQALLAAEIPHLYSRVIWLDALPGTLRGVVLANEVLDALPAHLIHWTAHGPMERGVALDPENGAFVWADRAIREPALAAAAAALPITPPYLSEINLAANALVASGRGVFPREVRAPREGRVVAAGGGQVLLEVGEVNVELRAGISGQVTRLIPERGVLIQTTGALIQGVWGNGRIEMGVMTNLMEKPDSTLEAKRLDVSLRGSVILGGMVREAETLRAAGELPVRGLILSSLHPALLPLALQMRYPIVVIDGLGNLPMNSAAYRLLTTNAKRDTAVNAEMFDRYSGARPEVIIPLPVSQEPAQPDDIETFAAGQQVRLRAGAHLGKLASLAHLRPGLATLPSGLRAPAADVRLENGEQILVPLANLEVVG